MKPARGSNSTVNNDNNRVTLTASDTEPNPTPPMSDFKNDCYDLASKHVLCIEFVLTDTEREGFHTGQLLHYRLEPNSSDETDAPPERLTLAFATTDAVILGRKLSTLAKHLRDGDLLSVRALPTRYANLDKSKCAVAAIAVEPVKANG